ncbi:MAG: hypothetical protein HRK26_02590 [Rickettsiaceae bacterium H1]|nr:hypothetical protein [Rickettsiaceae bacterium H1]
MKNAFDSENMDIDSLSEELDVSVKNDLENRIIKQLTSIRKNRKNRC